MRAIFLIIFVLTFFSCKSKMRDCRGKDDLELIIENKASFCFDGLDSIRISKKDSRLICNQFDKSLKITNKVYVNNNYGFFEILDKDNFFFFIIFSEYNGPIIKYKDEYYTNNSLIKSVFNYLKIRPKEDFPTVCEEKIFSILNEHPK